MEIVVHPLAALSTAVTVGDTEIRLLFPRSPGLPTITPVDSHLIIGEQKIQIDGKSLVTRRVM